MGYSDDFFAIGFRHFKNHPEYNEYVMRRLDDIAATVKWNTKNENIANAIQALADELAYMIDAKTLIVK
jgi:hypothetical protein